MLSLENETKKQIESIVIEELNDYKALRVAMKNKKEQQEKAMEGIFPSLCDGVTNEIKYNQIERAINEALTDVEREIIEKRFLSPSPPKDIIIYSEMGLKRDLYYVYKKKAIKQIARSLGII